MRSRAGLVFLLVAVAGVAFLAGWLGREYRLLEGSRYTLERPLELSASTGEPGRLPAGTSLYEFRVLPEISTFVVFVNTKRRDALRGPAEGQGFVVAPVDAY